MSPEIPRHRSKEVQVADAQITLKQRVAIENAFPDDIGSQWSVVELMGKLDPKDGSLLPSFPGNVTLEEAIRAVQKVNNSKQ